MTEAEPSQNNDESQNVPGSTIQHLNVIGLKLVNDDTVIGALVGAEYGNYKILFPLKIVEMVDNDDEVTQLFDRWIRSANETSTVTIQGSSVICVFTPDSDAVSSYTNLLTNHFSTQQEEVAEEDPEPVEELDEIDREYQRLMKERAEQVTKKQETEKEEKVKQKKKKVIH